MTHDNKLSNELLAGLFLSYDYPFRKGGQPIQRHSHGIDELESPLRTRFAKVSCEIAAFVATLVLLA